jgi:hypothetical protein
VSVIAWAVAVAAIELWPRQDPRGFRHAPDLPVVAALASAAYAAFVAVYWLPGSRTTRSTRERLLVGALATVLAFSLVVSAATIMIWA